MTRRLLTAPLLAAGLLLAVGLLLSADRAAAQDPPTRAQRLTGRLQAGETDAYLLKDLQAGDTITVSMRSTSGDLDPAVGIVDTTEPLMERMTRYQAELQQLIAQDAVVGAALTDLRNRTYLAWDDDSGVGYAAALQYTVAAQGDYVLIAGASLSSLGRATSGDYELLLGINAPAAGAGQASSAGPSIAERIPAPWGLASSVQEVTGSLTASNPEIIMQLADIDAGDTLSVRVEATSGDLVPIVILRDYGGKPLEAGNLGGKESWATLAYTTTEPAVGYSLDIQAAQHPDGGTTAGDYRLLLGLNAPDVAIGQAQPQGNPILAVPTEVKTGLKIQRISAVNSPDENFTALASLRMDWTDPALAFSPDTCNCSVKLYSDKEVDNFLAEVGSRWPAFSFFNQLGNRWTQSRAAAIWPDGRARYAESFNTTFQADFDFKDYPFDTQTFPIYLDLVYPTSFYTMTALPGYSEIDPAHGEDEFVITDFNVTPGTAMPTAADQPVSRMTFSFSAPRNLDYYLLQVFLPILLIILISWFTFFLHDYTRRIEAAAANILLFIAFSWSLASNYPRLGYLTFLDAIMTVTFVVNVVVLLYNVYMKRLEGQGQIDRVEHIDNVLDWAYPLSYAVLIGMVVLIFF